MTFRGAGFRAVATFTLACPAAFCAQTAQAQVKLEFKFPEGRKLTYTTTSRTRQVLSFMGMGLESARKETKEWSRSVDQRQGDSTLPIEEKVNFINVDYALPDGIKLSLDSRTPDLKIDNTPLALLRDMFKLESAIAYRVLLDKETRVKAIEGADKLFQMAEKLSDPTARQEFQTEKSADRLKARFEQELHRLPEAPVRTGESWERAEVLDINGKTLNVRKKYEYRGTEKKGDKVLEKISFRVLEVKYDPGSQTNLPLKVVKSDLKVESSDGTILFDREQGDAVGISERIRIKGGMTVSANGVDQSGEFNLTFDTSTQLSPVPK